MTTNNAAITPAADVSVWFDCMPLTRSHLVAAGILFGAFVIEAWEMMIIILNSNSIGAEFALDTERLGRLIGALFLGMIPGALVWGRLADRLGRKRCLIYSLVLYSPLPILSAMAPTFEFLWVVRFICGMILVGSLVVTFPYFEELVPTKSRGRATVYLSAGWPIGVLVAVGVSLLLMPLGWRWVIGVSSLAVLWALLVHRFVPESPYWLAGQDRTEEAARVITRLSAGRLNARVRPASKPSDSDLTLFSIFRRPTIRITLLQITINFCFAWGYWGLTSWMPELLAKQGLSAPEGLGFIALSAVFMLPGYITASFLTGRYGRKPVMLLYVTGAVICGFNFAFAGTITELYVWNFALSFFNLGAWGIWNTWMGEIYPTRLRGAGVAWGITLQRISNALAPFAIGAMLVSGSFLQIVTFICLFLVIVLVLVLFVPETEGKALA